MTTFRSIGSFGHDDRGLLGVEPGSLRVIPHDVAHGDIHLAVKNVSWMYAGSLRSTAGRTSLSQ